MTTAAQLRAARAILGLSQADVAASVGVSLPTIKRAEAGGRIRVAVETLEIITAALEKAGAEFMAENGGGPGVRLKKQRPKHMKNSPPAPGR